METSQHAPEHHRYRLVNAARLAAMVLDAGELLEVMVAEVGDAPVQRAKRAAVRREHQGRGIARFEPCERIEERAQRIGVGGGWKHADVG
jgi:GNAT superfamily N-acetyltransferase